MLVERSERSVPSSHGRYGQFVFILIESIGFETGRFSILR